MLPIVILRRVTYQRLKKDLTLLREEDKQLKERVDAQQEALAGNRRRKQVKGSV